MAEQFFAVSPVPMLGAKVRILKAGRQCAGSRCATVLNQYHKGKYCYACEDRLIGKRILRELDAFEKTDFISRKTRR